MTAWFAGLLLGAAGSGHCALMCGPLVMTITRTLRPPSRAVRIRQALTYHAGRIFTYLLIALPLGFASELLAVQGFGRIVSVATGVLIGLSALSSRHLLLPAALGRHVSLASTRACVTANTWMRSHPAAGPVVAGVVNGLLPCGLVYAAAAAAAATGSTIDALALMFGFGLGSVPALLALTVSSSSVPAAWRPRLRQLAPAALLLVAALLIFRGVVPSAAHQRDHVQVHSHTPSR
jgi:uncharacterized protein